MTQMMPTRDNAKTKLVADLDSLIEDSIPFRLHGKNHEILPISTLEFFKFSENLARLSNMRSAENLTKEEVFEAYYDLINPVCPTIGIDDIEKCSYAQIGALVQLVLDKVMGRMPDSKKKALIENPSLLLTK